MIIEKTEFRIADPADRLGILALHRRAFGREDEARLVDTLTDAACATVSMVARIDGMIVGHVMLSELQGPERSLALAPLGVDPDWRDFQIGTELTRRAISVARKDGWLCVFVQGDPVYYGRFGFKKGVAEGVSCDRQGPHFMALELENGALNGYRGEIRYPDAFGAA
ncbi:GNAT family N-acetyltransferase [Oricola sp.]|uniref:GNAT family N-acetyltransferase n=1 Tax=Oricola sp. TaxID=1979950 RepID=UPI003BAD6E03